MSLLAVLLALPLALQAAPVAGAKPVEQSAGVQPVVPAAARALKERGDLLRAAGEPAAALVSYGQALKLHGAYVEALAAQGEVLAGQARYREAVKVFAAAVEIEPTFAMGWSQLASAAARDGDLPRAREAYQQYAALRPTDPEGHLGLAETARLIVPDKENLFATVEFDRTAWERVQLGLDRWSRRAASGASTSGAVATG